MSQKYQRVKIVIKFCQRFCRRFFTTRNRQIIWLLRAIFGTSRRQESGSAGFVLPTVVLVSLVVVLLTTAILFRAFDRSKNASYVRVNQALVNAAMPAVDRAKAKLNQLLSDPGLPRSTPTDVALYGLIKNIPSSTSNNTIYTAYNFGDETPLELALDVNGNGKLDNGYNSTGTTYTIENDESLNSAWKFPIDTDNNGRFDTYTIYAIYFRNPPRTTSGSQAGDFNRARSALEARTPPMNQYEAGGSCAAALGTSAGLVGDSSWYKLGGSLAKSFYVYTTNVPITDITNLSASNYEVKVGRGLSSLEYEQDRFQSPIGNNAVWYVNDLEIYPGVSLYINGAIHTDANLMGGPTSSATLAFRQVSGINSCYYLEDNAKVTVGGNTAVGSVWSTSSNTSVFGNIEVDLYTIGAAPSTSNTIGSSGTTTDSLNSTQSTTEKTISQTSAAGYVVGYNDAAYNSRINLMTNTALSLCGSTTLTPPTAANNTCSTATTVTALKSAVDGTTTIYPSDLISSFDSAIRSANYPDSDYQDAYNTLNTQIQLYFSNRTRRVPFSEVPYTNTTSTNALYEYAGSTTAYAANGGTSVTNPVFATSPIDVPESWRDIVSNDGNSTKYTGLTFTSPFQFPATNPPDLAKKGYEIFTGDRILVGNNLPAYWRDYTQTNSPYVTGTATQTVDGTTNWLSTSGTSSGVLRTRSTQIQPQLNLGVTDRGQYWE